MPLTRRLPIRIPALAIVSLLTVLGPSILNQPQSLAQDRRPGTPAQQTRTASPYVGSAMAVLATLEQAQVLPPEGTREADQIIKFVIQFQSAFGKSAGGSVQDFLSRAVSDKHGARAPEILERFRSSGWTSDVLEALMEAEHRTPIEELEPLQAELGQFNLTVDDFKRFMQLVRNGHTALAAKGRNFHEVYAHHRNAMPGQRTDK